MSRSAKLLLLPIFACCLTSCDRSAQEFAKNTSILLDEYAARIDGQINAESQYYQRDAVLEVNHQHENSLNSSIAAREEQGLELAIALNEGGKSTLRVRSYLREYAESEYTRLRAAYSGDVDLTRAYLGKLQALQANKDRVQALEKLLDGLARKLSIAGEVSTIKQTVSETKTNFDTLICDDIATKLRSASGTAKDSLTQLQTDRKCPTSGATQ